MPYLFIGGVVVYVIFFKLSFLVTLREFSIVLSIVIIETFLLDVGNALLYIVDPLRRLALWNVSEEVEKF